MVAFDTVNTNLSGKPSPERPLADDLASVAAALGFATTQLPIAGDDINLLVTHEVDARAPWLLFESHMDTVSVAGMTIDPFGGEILDGRIYARGACDTKGTGAAMLWAMQDYAAGPDQHLNVGLVFVTDEEVQKSGVRAFTEQQLGDLPWIPAGVVVGEPTGLRMYTAHNGCVRWWIRTRGVAAHSSDPDRGRSAISAMTKVIDAIETEYAAKLTTSHPLTGKATCTINVIDGGTSINIIPEQCSIYLDRRTVPGEDSSRVLPDVEAVLDRLRAGNADLEVAQDEPLIVDPALDPALDPTGSSCFADVVARTLEDAGLSGEPLGARYGTDASQFSVAGIPTIVLGPGDIAQAHTKDEWLDLAELERGVEIYLALMRSSGL